MQGERSKRVREAVPWILALGAMSVESGLAPDRSAVHRAASVVLAGVALGMPLVLVSAASGTVVKWRRLTIVVAIATWFAFGTLSGAVASACRPAVLALGMLAVRPIAPGSSAAPWMVTAIGTLISIGRLTDQAVGWTPALSEQLAWFAAALPAVEGKRAALLGVTYLGGVPVLATALALVLAAITAATTRRRVLVAITVLIVGVLLNLYSPSMPRTLLTVIAAASIGVTGPSLLAWEVTPVARRTALATLLVSVVVSLLPFSRSPAGPLAGSTRLVRGGFSTALPTVDRSSEPDGASIGRFVQFLERSATDFQLIDRVESLAQVRLLVFVNLERRLDDLEQRAVQEFVEAGGRLLVFGDHTNIKNVMDSTNPLIRRFGTELKFDSAMPDLRTGHRHWEGSVEAIRGGANLGIVDPELWQVSVGASLSVRSPARPLVVARAGFSDIGDESAPQRAYLGNWKPDRGLEQEGDLVLASVATIGSGVVVVYGDTSIIQSTSFSDSWLAVATTLQWLRDGRSSDRPAATWLAALAVILAISASVLWLSAGPTRGEALTAMALLVTLAISVDAHDHDVRKGWFASARQPSDTLWFDVRRGSPLSRVGDTEDGVSAFFRAMTIAGKLPLFWHAEDTGVRPRSGDVIVIGPGGAAPSGDEVREIVRTVAEDGADLVVVLDERDAARTAALATVGGVATTELPLGRCPGASTVVGAAPPSLHSAWALQIEESGCRPLIRAWDHPVMTERQLGRGRVIVIGDRRFVENINLARGAAVDRESTQFLSALFGSRR